MKSITLPAYAKVNLYLSVLGKRPDGYHELLTLFERVDLSDELTVELLPRAGLELACDHPGVPSDGSNLICRAVEAYRQAAGWKQGLRISLRKRIPVAGGMGGGSADAAAALSAMQRLTGQALPEPELLKIARGLGADVPFLLGKAPWALGRGRGDEVEPLSLTGRIWHLLIWPGFPIPTPAVYRAFVPSTELRAGLTPHAPDVKLLRNALQGNDVPRIRGLLFNALEPTVEALYPAIRHVKTTMETTGGLCRPLVSGSGSTVFALCASEAQAQEAADRLSRCQPAWTAIVSKTV